LICSALFLGAANDDSKSAAAQVPSKPYPLQTPSARTQGVKNAEESAIKNFEVKTAQNAAKPKIKIPKPAAEALAAAKEAQATKPYRKANAANRAAPIDGYWEIPDSDTGKPQAAVYVYESGGKFFCRMVAIYDADGKIDETVTNPKSKADGIDAKPYLCGLDLIRDLSPDGDVYDGGSVIDPDSGSSFDCAVHYDAAKKALAVRGSLFGIGETQYWPRLSADALPAGARIDKGAITPKVY